MFFQLDSVSEENRRGEKKSSNHWGYRSLIKQDIEIEAAGRPEENSKELVKNLKEHTEEVSSKG